MKDDLGFSSTTEQLFSMCPCCVHSRTSQSKWISRPAKDKDDWPGGLI